MYSARCNQCQGVTRVRKTCHDVWVIPSYFWRHAGLDNYRGDDGYYSNGLIRSGPSLRELLTALLTA